MAQGLGDRLYALKEDQTWSCILGHACWSQGVNRRRVHLPTVVALLSTVSGRQQDWEGLPALIWRQPVSEAFLVLHLVQDSYRRRTVQWSQSCRNFKD